MPPSDSEMAQCLQYVQAQRVVFAADPNFVNISDDDMKVIAKGMGSNFTHNSMMGASKLGTVFGFQVGVVAAQTTTPKLDDLADVKELYNAGIMAAVGIPFGISFEAAVMPTYKNENAKLSSSSFALKYNINDVIPILPINLALRAHTATSEFSFSQVVSSVNAKVTNTTDVSGVQLLLSPMFPVVEPYIGVGTLSAKDKLKVSSGTIFDAGGSELSKTVTGTQVLAGVEVNLLLLKLGVEYSNAFDNSRYGFKLSFGF